MIALATNHCQNQALTGLQGLIDSVALDPDIDYPNIPAQALNISSIAFAEGVTVPLLVLQHSLDDQQRVSVDGLIT